MRLESLKHISGAVATMLEGERVVVFGSASLLASFPELGSMEGSPLLRTYDADLIPYPFEEEVGVMLDESFGEGRTFHKRFGYHADIVRPRVSETFPVGWEDRLISLQGVKYVYCLSPHDMAAAKCLVGREKDKHQLLFLLRGAYLCPDELRCRISEIDLSAQLTVKVFRFFDALLEEV